MPKFVPTVKKFVLTISTDADIFDKYPNFRFNFDNPEQFIAHLSADIAATGTDSHDEESFGYSITVEPIP